jgi:hypothetical protein
MMPSRATFVTRRDLKDRSRWMALASGNFGSFSNDFLIGNFGDGTINVFALNGNFLGTLDSNGSPITIEGLWGLRFGNGGNGGAIDQLFFAGIPGPGGNVEDMDYSAISAPVSPNPPRGP